MAPIPALSTYSFHDAAALGLEPFSYDESKDSYYTRQLHSYLQSLGLEERDSTVGESLTASNFKRSLSDLIPSSGSPRHALSPRAVGEQLRGRDSAPPPPANGKGTGTINPVTVNNKSIFILFGLLFSGLVITSIWFFFWAKNGGFHFRKGDWDEYKSTVLRRKDKNGKTLSNATKSTDLGGDSIAGEYDREDMVHDRMGRDNDVREYRHEKPARVGGLNRKADGSYRDHTNTGRSETMPEKPAAKKSRNPFAAKKAPEKKKAARQPAYARGDDMSTVAEHDFAEQRPHRPQRSSQPNTRRPNPRSSGSPNKRAREQEAVFSDDAYTDNGSSGTKSYHHPIPGLGKAGRNDATLGTEPREKKGKGGGYRRGGGRRRDSLSDSD